MTKKANPMIEEAEIVKPERTMNTRAVSSVVAELQHLHNELQEFSKQLDAQLAAAAKTDNVTLMFETKGMMRVTAMFVSQIAQRVEALSVVPTMGSAE